MFERLADRDFAYLTTTGRRTGQEHTIEIWFGLRDGRIYMLSGGGDRAAWVRNLRKTPRVRVRIGTQTTTGAARAARAGTKAAVELGEDRSRRRDRASLDQRTSGQ